MELNGTSLRVGFRIGSARFRCGSVGKFRSKLIGPTSPLAPVGVEVPSSPIYYTANTVTVTVGGKVFVPQPPSAMMLPAFQEWKGGLLTS